MPKLTNYFTRFNGEYFFSGSTERGLLIWLGIYLFLIVAAFVIFIILKKKAKETKPYKRFAKMFFWTNFSFELTGLLLVFLSFESLAIFSYRLWNFLLCATIIAINIYLVFYYRGKLQADIKIFNNKARKEKWLPRGKKKK